MHDAAPVLHRPATLWSDRAAFNLEIHADVQRSTSACPNLEQNRREEMKWNID